MAEKSSLKETIELEQEEIELQAKIARDRLILKQKLREAEMMKVELETDLLEEELRNVEGGERSHHESSRSEISAVHALLADPRKQGQSPAGDLLAVALAKQNEFTQLLAESHERAVLPKRQLDVFDGSDLTVFRTFLTAFENLFEKACTNDSDKLAYLGQYTAEYSALTNEQPLKLNDEEFGTLMCEVEAILNNRPLTPVSDNPDDLEALTPNHLLLLNAGVTFPTGLFCKSDAYSKKSWKQVQYLADMFWTRWQREYLKLLQTHQKWTTDTRSVQPGDLVSDNQLPRNQWPLGRIVEIKPDDAA
ncbi:hypothetical protein HAZT_HAZT011574 [Hyalella azteca]|uniref:DUF5641 domain-containing protein n=1 Tax=Hyalella azteca TaxID=294128 RepID=A0A6A0H4J3_HYAAZ|nr:hypothetical protein HAZT_HAZT011574 [Hyalella azteca]